MTIYRLELAGKFPETQAAQRKLRRVVGGGHFAVGRLAPNRSTEPPYRRRRAAPALVRPSARAAIAASPLSSIPH